MAPFNLATISSSLIYNLIFLLLGMGFGASLELSGFGDSRKLAAQFYLKDLTVLKVMFTAIIVAATLIVLSSALGLLDYTRLWVNPTYLWPGIIGGLIMGVGFILGGFCPGTSLVAASTLKIDGIIFVLGVFTGVWIFGDSVHLFDGFWNSSAMGRFTLPELFGVPTGVALILLILMALAMFYGGEIAEKFFGKKETLNARSFRPKNKAKIAAAAVLLSLALATVVIGQPTVEDRWDRVATEGERLLGSRDVFVHPREVVDLKKNTTLKVAVYDLRDEGDYNLFHIAGAMRVDFDEVKAPEFVKRLQDDADNVIHFLVGNGDFLAAMAWRSLKAQGVLNLYIVDGGVNHWLDIYKPAACVATKGEEAGEETLKYKFQYAVGDRIPQAHPDFTGKDPLPCVTAVASLDHHAASNDHATEAQVDYVKKVKLQKKVVAKGGCG